MFQRPLKGCGVDDQIKFLPAIEAAMHRVLHYRHLSVLDFEREAAWQLHYMKHDRSRINWRSSRLGLELLWALAEAQNWRCCYCGVHMTADGPTSYHRHATLEHVIPLARGGSDHPDNMVAACFWCNQERGHVPIHLYLKTVQPYYV